MGLQQADGDLTTPSAPVVDRDLLDGLSGAVLALDSDATIFYVNPAAERLYGIDRARMLGTDAVDLLFRAEDRQRVRQVVADVLAGHRWTGTFPLHCADGRFHPLQVTDSPLRHDGEIVGLIGEAAPNPVDPWSWPDSGTTAATGPASGFGWESLTRSEQRVAWLVAQGLTNRAIADRLIVSRHTVDAHLKHIYVKLQIHSRVQLTVLALKNRPE